MSMSLSLFVVLLYGVLSKYGKAMWKAEEYSGSAFSIVFKQISNNQGEKHVSNQYGQIQEVDILGITNMG